MQKVKAEPLPEAFSCSVRCVSPILYERGLVAFSLLVDGQLYKRMDKGYDVGSAGADGRVGTATKAALVKFQKDNGLPVGALDTETLRALGVR